MFTQEHHSQAQASCIESGNADSCVEATATKAYMSATCADTQQTDTSAPSITTDQDYASSSNADMQRVINNNGFGLPLIILHGQFILYCGSTFEDKHKTISFHGLLHIQMRKRQAFARIKKSRNPKHMFFLK